MSKMIRKSVEFKNTVTVIVLCVSAFPKCNLPTGAISKQDIDTPRAENHVSQHCMSLSTGSRRGGWICITSHVTLILKMCTNVSDFTVCLPLHRTVMSVHSML